MRVRVVVAVVALLVATASVAAADGGHLRFDFGPPGQPANYRHDRSCPLVSMSWVDEKGRVAWTRPAPEQLRGNTAICECGAEDPAIQMAAAWRPCQRMVERSYSHAPEWLGFMTGVERRAGVVALAHRGGIVTIDERDGTTIAAWTRPKTSGAYVAVDHADYRLEGVRSCSGRTRGSTIVAWCGDLLLYFADDFAALLRGPSLQRVASAIARRRDVTTVSRDDSVIVRTRARLRLGRYRLVIDGSYDDHP